MSAVRALDGNLHPLHNAIIKVDGEREPGYWYVDLVYRGWPNKLVPIKKFLKFTEAQQCANRLALHLPGAAS